MAELILIIMVIYVTMVYGPIAAFLVELFPAKIRYNLDVLAVSHRQRLVRRHAPPAGDGHRGQGRKHLRGPLVPDRSGLDDGRDRHVLRP